MDINIKRLRKTRENGNVPNMEWEKGGNQKKKMNSKLEQEDNSAFKVKH